MRKRALTITFVLTILGNGTELKPVQIPYGNGEPHNACYPAAGRSPWSPESQYWIVLRRFSFEETLISSARRPDPSEAHPKVDRKLSHACTRRRVNPRAPPSLVSIDSSARGDPVYVGPSQAFDRAHFKTSPPVPTSSLSHYRAPSRTLSDVHEREEIRPPMKVTAPSDEPRIELELETSVGSVVAPCSAHKRAPVGTLKRQMGFASDGASVDGFMDTSLKVDEDQPREKAIGRKRIVPADKAATGSDKTLCSGTERVPGLAQVESISGIFARKIGNEPAKPLFDTKANPHDGDSATVNENRRQFGGRSGITHWEESGSAPEKAPGVAPARVLRCATENPPEEGSGGQCGVAPGNGSGGGSNGGSGEESGGGSGGGSGNGSGGGSDGGSGSSSGGGSDGGSGSGSGGGSGGGSAGGSEGGSEGGSDNESAGGSNGGSGNESGGASGGGSANGSGGGSDAGSGSDSGGGSDKGSGGGSGGGAGNGSGRGSGKEPGGGWDKGSGGGRDKGFRGGWNKWSGGGSGNQRDKASGNAHASASSGASAGGSGSSRAHANSMSSSSGNAGGNAQSSASGSASGGLPDGNPGCARS